MMTVVLPLSACTNYRLDLENLATRMVKKGLHFT